MNIYLVSEYVKRLTKEDIIKFAFKKSIVLKEKEIDIIFDTIKKHYKVLIYGNPKEIFDDLRNKIEPMTMNKIETLYLEFRKKIS